MIRVQVNKTGAVDCRSVLHLPLSALQVWGQIRDFHSYARSDFFHADIEIEGGSPRAGAGLKISHRFFLFRIPRVGRICSWKESVGYSFSDLSATDRLSGFPHIFSYRLKPTSEESCELHICVRGKWTARRMPNWLTWIWLFWIFEHITTQVNNQLLRYRIWLARKQRAN